MMQSIQKDAAARMEKSVKSLEHELSKNPYRAGERQPA